MGFFDFLKDITNKTIISETTTSTKPEQKLRFDYPVADFQWDFVVSEIKRLNKLLKTLECTKHLRMDSTALTHDSYFRYEPFTLKTGRISKYPCILYACSTVYMGYSVSIFYNSADEACKGTISISKQKCDYTIDYKKVDNELKIIKVITTNNKNGNEKLYHIKSNGEIYQK